MISVLIPVFNYNVVALVSNIHTQLQLSAIPFEIICLDDGSKPETIQQNSEISTLEFTTYEKNTVKSGRTGARQLLSQKATYNWLLFMDADVMPISGEFIKNYIKQIDSKNNTIYGGFAYKETPPDPEYLLRWHYGKTYEQVPASQRNKRPYKIIISANFMIQKTLFCEINSQVKAKGYGFDNFFGALLKTKKASVLHINNAVYHLGIETSKVYLQKKERAAETLLMLHKSNKITNHQNDLLNLYIKLKQFGGNHLFSAIFKLFGKHIKVNLLGKNPSMKLLQLYRISFMCYKDLNPN